MHRNYKTKSISRKRLIMQFELFYAILTFPIGILLSYFLMPERALMYHSIWETWGSQPDGFKTAAEDVCFIIFGCGTLSGAIFYFSEYMCGISSEIINYPKLIYVGITTVILTFFCLNCILRFKRFIRRKRTK